MDKCSDSYINRSRRSMVGGEALNISGDLNEWGLPESSQVVTIGYCKPYLQSGMSPESCESRKKHLEGVYSISKSYGDRLSAGMKKCRKCKGPINLREVKLNEGPLTQAEKRAVREPTPVLRRRLKSLAERIKEERV